MRVKHVLPVLVLVSLLVGCQSSKMSEYEADIKEYEEIIETLQTNQEDLQEELNLVEVELNETIKSKSLFYEDLEEQMSLVKALEEEIASYETLDTSTQGSSLVSEDKSLRVVNYENDEIKYMYETEVMPMYSTHTIIGYDLEFYDPAGTTEILDYTGDSNGSVKIKVFGSLYNFTLSYIEWDDKFEKISIVEEIFSIDEVRNQDVIFSSPLPEGLPYELLSWNNEEGEIRTMFISEDGYGFSGDILIAD